MKTLQFDGKEKTQNILLKHLMSAENETSTVQKMVVDEYNTIMSTKVDTVKECIKDIKNLDYYTVYEELAILHLSAMIAQHLGLMDGIVSDGMSGKDWRNNRRK